MSVRRRDENALGTRRPQVLPSAKKVVLGNENALTPIIGKLKPSGSKSSATDDKTEARNIGSTRRPALTSLTNGTPQSRPAQRRPLSAKPTARQATSIPKPLVSTKSSSTTRTPGGKPKVRKALSVYTPARPHVKDDNHGLDEIEYMAPSAIEAAFEPPTPMRATSRGDDNLFLTSGPEPALDVDVGLHLDDVTSEFRLAPPDSPDRPRVEKLVLEVDEPQDDDFHFEV